MGLLRHGPSILTAVAGGEPVPKCVWGCRAVGNAHGWVACLCCTLHRTLLHGHWAQHVS